MNLSPLQKKKKSTESDSVIFIYNNEERIAFGRNVEIVCHLLTFLDPKWDSKKENENLGMYSVNSFVKRHFR